MTKPQLSITLPSFGPAFANIGGRDLLTLASLCDEAGVDRLLLPDHVIMSTEVADYPFGDFPFAVNSPWLEPLSTLAAMAGMTQNVRLSTKILIAPLRSAPLLAKTLATLDVLSEGRMEVGVGPGWQSAEYSACGVDWTRRGQLLTDTIAACRALWEPGPANFESSSFTFKDIWCEPKPVQPAGIPVWFAGTLNERNLTRITMLGEGWIPPAYASSSDLAEATERLRYSWAQAGRGGSPRVQGDLAVAFNLSGKPDIDKSMAAAGELISAGATTVNVVLSMFASRFERAADAIPRIVSAWRSAID